jgi:drug/metabolite transporter (DMT)-like permease
VLLSLAVSWAAQLTLRHNRDLIEIGNDVKPIVSVSMLVSLGQIAVTSGASLILTIYLYNHFTFFQVATIQLSYTAGAIFISNYFLDEKVSVLKIIGVLTLIIGFIIILVPEK